MSIEDHGILLPGDNCAFVMFNELSDLLDVYSNSEMNDQFLLGQQVKFLLCEEDEMMDALEKIGASNENKEKPEQLQLKPKDAQEGQQSGANPGKSGDDVIDLWDKFLSEKDARKTEQTSDAIKEKVRRNRLAMDRQREESSDLNISAGSTPDFSRYYSHSDTQSVNLAPKLNYFDLISGSSVSVSDNNKGRDVRESKSNDRYNEDFVNSKTNRTHQNLNYYQGFNAASREKECSSTRQFAENLDQSSSEVISGNKEDDSFKWGDQMWSRDFNLGRPGIKRPAQASVLAGDLDKRPRIGRSRSREPSKGRRKRSGSRGSRRKSRSRSHSRGRTKRSSREKSEGQIRGRQNSSRHMRSPSRTRSRGKSRSPDKGGKKRSRSRDKSRSQGRDKSGIKNETIKDKQKRDLKTSRKSDVTKRDDIKDNKKDHNEKNSGKENDKMKSTTQKDMRKNTSESRKVNDQNMRKDDSKSERIHKIETVIQQKLGKNTKHNDEAFKETAKEAKEVKSKDDSRSEIISPSQAKTAPLQIMPLTDKAKQGKSEKEGNVYVQNIGQTTGQTMSVPMEGHFVRLKHLPPWTSLYSVHQMFKECFVIKERTKIVHEGDEVKCVYLQLASEEDAKRACQRNNTVIDETFVIEVKSISAQVYAHELSEAEGTGKTTTHLQVTQEPFSGPMSLSAGLIPGHLGMAVGHTSFMYGTQNSTMPLVPGTPQMVQHQAAWAAPYPQQFSQSFPMLTPGHTNAGHIPVLQVQAPVQAPVINQGPIAPIDMQNQLPGGAVAGTFQTQRVQSQINTKGPQKPLETGVLAQTNQGRQGGLGRQSIQNPVQKPLEQPQSMDSQIVNDGKTATVKVGIDSVPFNPQQRPLEAGEGSEGKVIEEEILLTGFVTKGSKHFFSVKNHFKDVLKVKFVKKLTCDDIADGDNLYSLRVRVGINKGSSVFPRFAVYDNEFCYIKQVSQEKGCPVCRSPIKHTLNEKTCDGIETHDSIFIEELHILSPTMKKEIVYKNMTYPSIMEALEHQMILDIGEAAAKRAGPKRHSWLISKYSLVSDLILLRLATEKQILKLILNWPRSSNIVYLGLDPILGIGMQHILPDCIGLRKSIKPGYWDGFNMIGQILEDQRNQMVSNWFTFKDRLDKLLKSVGSISVSKDTGNSEKPTRSSASKKQRRSRFSDKVKTSSTPDIPKKDQQHKEINNDKVAKKGTVENSTISAAEKVRIDISEQKRSNYTRHSETGSTKMKKNEKTKSNEVISGSCLPKEKCEKNPSFSSVENGRDKKGEKLRTFKDSSSEKNKPVTQTQVVKNKDMNQVQKAIATSDGKSLSQALMKEGKVTNEESKMQITDRTGPEKKDSISARKTDSREVSSNDTTSKGDNVKRGGSIQDSGSMVDKQRVQVQDKGEVKQGVKQQNKGGHKSPKDRDTESKTKHIELGGPNSGKCTETSMNTLAVKDKESVVSKKDIEKIVFSGFLKSGRPIEEVLETLKKWLVKQYPHKSSGLDSTVEFHTDEQSQEYYTVNIFMASPFPKALPVFCVIDGIPCCIEHKSQFDYCSACQNKHNPVPCKKSMSRQELRSYFFIEKTNVLHPTHVHPFYYRGMRFRSFEAAMIWLMKQDLGDDVVDAGEVNAIKKLRWKLDNYDTLLAIFKAMMSNREVKTAVFDQLPQRTLILEDDDWILGCGKLKNKYVRKYKPSSYMGLNYYGQIIDIIRQEEVEEVRSTSPNLTKPFRNSWDRPSKPPWDRQSEIERERGSRRPWEREYSDSQEETAWERQSEIQRERHSRRPWEREYIDSQEEAYPQRSGRYSDPPWIKPPWERF